MTKTKKSKLTSKWIPLILLFITTISLVTNLFGINVSAHNSYFLSITIDESNFRYMPVVIFEDNSFKANNHREAEIGQFAIKTVEDNTSEVKDFTVPILSDADLKEDEDKIKEKYKSCVDEDGDGDEGLVYTFPGVHGRGVLAEKTNANDKDGEMANFISDNLVQGLNDALSFMKNSSGGIKTIGEFKRKAAELANTAYSVISTGSSAQISVNNKNFTISKNSPDTVVSKTNKDYYVRITDGTSSIFALTRINKGYQSRGDMSSDYKEDLKKYHDPEYLDWRYVVLQGNYNADALHNYYANLGEIVEPTAFEQAITNFFASCASGLRSILGLYELNELMLNTGSRNSNYFYGVMPKSWMNSASLLFVVCQILAFIVLGFSLVHLLFKRQLQTVNIGERISLIEGFKDLFVTAFALGSFALIFNLLLRLNYSLVNVFNKSSMASVSIGTTSTMIAGFMASILVNIAFLIISIYFNYIYILRAFSVAILFGIAPLAIVTISLGGKYKTVFSNYIKQLVSNIFLQSIHALCAAFFTNLTSTSQLRTIELLVVLISFVPLTHFIRESIFGLPSGLTENASNLMALTGTVAKGFKDKAGSVISGNKGKGSGYTGGARAFSGVNSARSSKITNAINKKSPTMDSGVASNTLASNLKSTPKGQNLAQNVYSAKKSNLAKAGGLAMKTLSPFANLGNAIGYAAVGDKYNMMKSAQSIAGGNMSDDDDDDLSNFGVNSVYDKGFSMVNVYKANENGEFIDEELANSEYGENFKEMIQVWTGKGDYAPNGSKAMYRDAAIAYYRSQGIQNISFTKSPQEMTKESINNFAERTKFGKKISETTLGEKLGEKIVNSQSDIVYPSVEYTKDALGRRKGPADIANIKKFNPNTVDKTKE